MLRHHAPSGVPAWGYAGSGPADLALSVLHHVLPLPDDTPRNSNEVRERLGIPLDADAEEQYFESLPPEERGVVERRFDQQLRLIPVELWDHHLVRSEVYHLHQMFKDEVLAKLAGEESHVLTREQISQWLRTKGYRMSR